MPERSSQQDSGDKKPRPCPICGKPPVDASKPFCSKRCADVDLHRWLGGVYALPEDGPGASDPASDEALSGDDG